MSFISYAQNNEDVLLWRALGDVAPGEGFYIDAGASDPVEHSVTKAFYDAGWRGINIEPLPVHIAAFEAQRPRDFNLAVAAGSADGNLVLYDVPTVRGWATPDPAVAARYRTAGHAVTESTVPVRMLASICAQHVAGPIHFLKIDVEGHEAEVLRGMDFARWRPWVLVIEATLPNSRSASHAAWEHLVTARGYRYAWFDGLNRYYVAHEHAGLLRHFGVQPNVFDDFMSCHVARALEAARRSDEALQAGDGELRAVQGRLEAALRSAETLAHERQAAQAGAAAARDEATRARVEAIAASAGAARARLDTAAARAKAAAALSEAHAARAGMLAALADADQARADAAAARAETATAHIAASAAQASATTARSAAAAARGEAIQARAVLVRAQAGLAQAQAEIARLHGEYEQAAASGRQAAAWARDLEQRLLAILASSSWRLTRPLRSASAFLRRLHRPGLARVLKHISASESLRRRLIPLLLRYPALGRSVSAMLRAARQDPAGQASPLPAPPVAQPASEVPDALRHLPASARAVLADLRRARSRPQRTSDRCAS